MENQNLSLKNEEGEIWKDIPNYEGIYQVSTHGRLKSLNRTKEQWRGGKIPVIEKILKYRDADKYYNILLSNNRIRHVYPIHQLVAMAFLNHIPNGRAIVVNHIDGNTKNNYLINLEITTHRQNTVDGYLRKETTSKYTGVSYEKEGSYHWKSNIQLNNKKIHLGRFKDELKASSYYNIAADNLDKYTTNNEFRLLIKNIYDSKFGKLAKNA